ncbi:MAG TPA: GyrI-like domain-containing protein [Gaiellaceae bacterium]|nr:GyrI-like domain-containing protein [Gaiellaceae bacterium]
MSDEHVVVREPVEVMLVRVVDELPEIQRAWAAFETAVGLRGRKFYGAFDPATSTYSVCAVLRPGDNPAAIGAERGTLPGGRYACVRLHGEPPGVYEQIGPTAQRLAQRPDADPARPTLEYYRRHDVIDVLVPVF